VQRTAGSLPEEWRTWLSPDGLRLERGGRLANNPLIFVDVDGPLIPFDALPVSRERSLGGPVVQPLGGTGNPLLDRLDPDDGRRLLALGYQLVWATTWMAEANEVISPRLELPDLPSPPPRATAT